jgi:hypothetical protein
MLEHWNIGLKRVEDQCNVYIFALALVPLFHHSNIPLFQLDMEVK